MNFTQEPLIVTQEKKKKGWVAWLVREFRSSSLVSGASGTLAENWHFSMPVEGADHG